MNKKDLRVTTLVEPPWVYQGSRPPSCSTPQQPTIRQKYLQKILNNACLKKLSGKVSALKVFL